MKKLVIIILILLSSSLGFGASLKWNPIEGEVTGYIIHYTRVGHVDDYVLNVGNVNTYSLTEGDLNLSYGIEYEFHLTGYNNNGEGDKSNTVTWLRPAKDIPAKTIPDLIINVPEGSSINVTITSD